MKARSPLRGYNHNVRYAGALFHVQTEDSGLQNPHVFTHLFVGGTILASKRVNYKVDDDDALVQQLMQGQHKAMLKDLRAGSFDTRIEQHLGRPLAHEPEAEHAPPLLEGPKTLIDPPPNAEPPTVPARVTSPRFAAVAPPSGSAVAQRAPIVLNPTGPIPPRRAEARPSERASSEVVVTRPPVVVGQANQDPPPPSLSRRMVPTQESPFGSLAVEDIDKILAYLADDPPIK